jgi:hypothetical protein
LLAAGCLQPGPLPEGRRLFAGRDISELAFVSLDDDTVPNQKVPWVAFYRRKAPATPSKGAVADLWIASLDGTQQRQVLANRSDRPEWRAQWSGGSLFMMVDERRVTNQAGQSEPVGTLVRIDSHFQPNVSFENISTFMPDGSHDNRLIYRQVSQDGETPGLFLWDGENQRRLTDSPTGSVNAQFSGSGAVYFVDNDRVLNRLGSPTDAIQALHANVNSFGLRGDERYAQLSLSDTDGTRIVVFDLQAGKDIPLARPNPCCPLGFSDPDLFKYSQSASPGAPAEYHTLDLTTGSDTALLLPDPLANLVGFMPREGGQEIMCLDSVGDSQSHGVIYRQSDRQPLRTVMKIDEATGTEVPAIMLTPQFSKDGKYLLYIDPRPPTETQPGPHGPLMIQETNYVDQPTLHPRRQLSADGMSVRKGAFFFIDGPTTDAGVTRILVFWASIVRSAEDIYFANDETGDLKVVANAIGNVEVDDHEIFGTVNESAQDMVGDLVVKNVQDSGGRTVAHAVAEATRGADPNTHQVLVAYVVRGRAASDHDGLWATTQVPPGQDGGP